MTKKVNGDPSDDPVDISAARQLFLDDHVIAERENVTREVAQVRKYSGNPILTANRPWDQHPVLYGSVILDPLEGYRMWYFTWDKRGGLHKFGHRYADRGFVGYARSDDGRSWEKPELDIVKYEGQRTNCVIGPKDIPHLTEFTTELLDTSGWYRGVGSIQHLGSLSSRDPRRRNSVLLRGAKAAAFTVLRKRFRTSGNGYRIGVGAAGPLCFLCGQLRRRGDIHETHNRFRKPTSLKRPGQTRCDPRDLAGPTPGALGTPPMNSGPTRLMRRWNSLRSN